MGWIPLCAAYVRRVARRGVARTRPRTVDGPAPSAGRAARARRPGRGRDGLVSPKTYTRWSVWGLLNDENACVRVRGVAYSRAWMRLTRGVTPRVTPEQVDRRLRATVLGAVRSRLALGGVGAGSGARAGCEFSGSRRPGRAPSSAAAVPVVRSRRRSLARRLTSAGVARGARRRTCRLEYGAARGATCDNRVGSRAHGGGARLDRRAMRATLEPRGTGDATQTTRRRDVRSRR